MKIRELFDIPEPLWSKCLSAFERLNISYKTIEDAGLYNGTVNIIEDASWSNPRNHPTRRPAIQLQKAST